PLPRLPRLAAQRPRRGPGRPRGPPHRAPRRVRRGPGPQRRRRRHHPRGGRRRLPRRDLRPVRADRARTPRPGHRPGRRGAAMSWLLPLPVLIPLIGAGLALALARFPRVQRMVTVAALTSVLGIAIVLLVLVNDGPMAVDIGGWAAPVGIALVADRLSSLLLVVSVAVTLGVLLYSLAQGNADGDEGAPVAIYHPTYLVLSAGVSNAFLTGDLFNLYVGFEMLLVSSFVLITLGGSRERVRAGTVYIVVSILSSVLFLAAIALVYAATGTVN